MPASSTIVVVGFAEALAAPEVVWSLIDAGYAVTAFSRQGKRAALEHSRYVTVHDIPAPESDARGAEAALLAFLNRVRSSNAFRHYVVLPLDDAALWLCGRVARTAGWTFAGAPNSIALDLALNKQQQIEAAQSAGFDVPATVVATEVSDLDRLPFGFPVILRPAAAARVSGQGLRKGRNWICADEGELAAACVAWNGDGPLLVQPYLDGIGEGIFGLSTDGGVVGWSGHRRLRMMNPHGSGSSACVSRRVDDRLKGPISTFLKTVDWKGMFMVELLHTSDGRLLFVEFNGRAWGSMALARRQGLEYPAWTVQLALGVPPDANLEGHLREGLECRHLGRELMHLLFVLRGRRSRAIRTWPPFWSSLREVLFFRRGSAVYNWRRSEWRVFATECYYTVLSNVSKTTRG